MGSSDLPIDKTALLILIKLSNVDFIFVISLIGATSPCDDNRMEDDDIGSYTLHFNSSFVHRKNLSQLYFLKNSTEPNKTLVLKLLN